jgi:hypothetical protein
MAEPYRRSLSELATRYEFEPKLRDVYVEGEHDRFVLGWFFDRSGRTEVAIYPILSVDVPAELLQPIGIFGNKGRVIALCKYLEDHLAVEARNVLGMVDKDAWSFLTEPLRLRYLATTDFACLECYALNGATIDKFFRLYLGKAIDPDRMTEMLSVLTELFVLRVAKQVVASDARWLNDFTRCCAIHGGKIVFDRDKFMLRLSNKSGGRLRRDVLEFEFTRLMERLPKDARHSINGHDLVTMLSWFAHQIGVDQSIYNETPLHRALITSIELEDLSSTPLFRSLIEWAKI